MSSSSALCNLYVRLHTKQHEQRTWELLGPIHTKRKWERKRKGSKNKWKTKRKNSLWRLLSLGLKTALEWALELGYDLNAVVPKKKWSLFSFLAFFTFYVTLFISRDAKRKHIQLIKDRKVFASRISEMQETCDTMMMQKFGRIVDLEKIETVTVNRNVEELKEKLRVNETLCSKDLLSWDVSVTIVLLSK